MCSCSIESVLLFFPSGALFRLIHQQSAVLVFSAMSTYDPQYCYILDAFLLLYCIIITTYLISQLNIRSLSNKSHFIWFNVFVFQGLSSVTKDTYDSLNKQPIHPPPR
uniref:Uncharacterized protein n=1 Tax=Sinocyclocheilus anshuiensis TaxID=1608454 RepID=A0A671KLX0_9TELE